MRAPTILVSLSEAEDEPRYFLRSSYVSAVQKAGGVPIAGFPLLDRVDGVDCLLDRVDGLLLTGGKDLHPLHFGEQPGPGLGPVFPNRDRFEIALGMRALERDMPVLGICRGLQVLNVAAGGTLHQDIDALPRASPILHRQTAARSWDWHGIRVAAGSRLAEVFGRNLKNGEMNVNSVHHQSVARVAEGWVVSAEAADGIIEAVECPMRAFALGVQWHPEDLAGHAPLFEALVSAARDFQSGSNQRICSASFSSGRVVAPPLNWEST